MWTEDYRDKNRINCYDTGTAPCKTACPAHIAVQGYLKMQLREDTRMHLHLLRRIIHSRQYVDMYVTEGVRMPVQEEQ